MRCKPGLVASAVLVFTGLVSGCGAGAFLRPDGDGGWDPQRRQAEIERLARPAPNLPAGESPSASAQAGQALDLADALRLASKRNHEIAEGRSRLGIAEEQVSGARGLLLPETTGSGRYTWYSNSQTNRIDFPFGNASGGPPPSVTVRESGLGVLNGTLRLPIDLSGELRYTLRAAQAGFRGERARLWATTLDQQVAVARAYFGLLEAQRLAEVAQQTLTVQQAQLDNARRRFDAGRLTKNELLVVQVALRQSEHALRQRHWTVDRTRRELNRVIGLEVETPTAIVDVDARPEIPPAEDVLQEAHRGNPLLTSLLEERQRLEARITALERGRFPSLAAGAAIDTSTSDLLEPRDIGSGFVGFTWNLGTDGRRAAEIAQGRHEADENRLAIERQLREIEMLVRSTHDAAFERLDAFEAADAAVSQAEENLRIRQEQFDVGRATSEDVLDAESLLSQQRAQRASALYQAHSRWAELRQLAGLGLGEAPSGPSAEVPTTIAEQPLVEPAPASTNPPDVARIPEPGARAEITKSGDDDWTCERTPEGARCRRLSNSTR